MPPVFWVSPMLSSKPCKCCYGKPITERMTDYSSTINVEMPADMNCIGASTGTICTVRCRNNALAGPFGGCFAVQQTDGGGRKDESAAGKSLVSSIASISSTLQSCIHTHPSIAIETTQTLEGISAQILQNQKDFDAAVAANVAAGAAADGSDGAAAISGVFSFLFSFASI